jgi:AbrB family looped-hinge helix DNA binding protein
MSEITSFHTHLGEDGRVVIPARVRRDLNLKPGDTLVAESDGQSLLMRSYDQVLQETQEFFRQFLVPGTSVVDELFAERREEAAREDAEAADRLPSHPVP